MGVMEKMRKSTGIILWILIFSFGLLWVLADTNLFNVIERGPHSLGSVNGEKISLKEFNQRVNNSSRQYSKRTGKSLTPEMRAQYQERAWNNLVTAKILQQKMDQLGIKVTDDELRNMITGKNPPPFIRKQFGKKDGTIDRVALRQAINSKRNTQIWIAVENQMRQRRRQQKMSNYMQTAMQISQAEVNQVYKNQNTKVDFSYVRFPYAGVKKSKISITDSDLRSYYDNHKDKYKRKKSYRFEYVAFDTSPTKEDTSRTIKDMHNLKQQFAGAKNDSLFFNNYQSTSPYSIKGVQKDNLDDTYKPVLKLKDKQVSDVLKEDGRLYLFKKIGNSADSVRFLSFTHDITADPVATIDKRSKTADDFAYYAKQKDFEGETQRRNLNLKKAFATKGNTFISGIGQSQQIMDFLNDAEEGDISKPIRLSGQFVVLNVTNVNAAGVQPFDEVKSQIRSVVVNNKRKQTAIDHAQKLLSANKNLQAIAKASGYKVQNVSSMPLSSSTIKGAGREPKVVGAISGLTKGDTSSPIDGTSAVFIIKVNKKTQPDLKNLSDAQRKQIRKQLQRQKNSVFMNVWMKQLKSRADIVDNRNRLLRGKS